MYKPVQKRVQGLGFRGASDDENSRSSFKGIYDEGSIVDSGHDACEFFGWMRLLRWLREPC